ncbi:MAG: phenylalanine--tRNA ligase subunit alpha [Candidatus Nealsonbacteria bacterium]
MNLENLKIEAKKQIEESSDLNDLDIVYKKYLGKKGEITLILRSLKDLSDKERKEKGKTTNQIKKQIEESIKEKKKIFLNDGSQIENDSIDISIPGKKIMIGHLHPLTLIKKEIEEIFTAMGFSIIEGPEIETEFYNFDALNIPADHPARDLWDTFWLKNGSLLRTHTSPVQIRYMEKNNPPFRVIAPGKIFRYEATDASHETNFYQVEGLMIGKDISVANFKAIIKEFLSRFFNKEVKIRLRPSFFPFVEPGFEVDVNCSICEGKGCKVCSQTGWLELMGAGMVHPNVLKAGKINPKNWQGFAFGVGYDRLAMMKYKINDIRLFHSGDLRFINQF